MKKILNDWTKLEKTLLFVSLIMVIFSGIICNSDVLTISCSITGILVAITQARGKVASQFLGILLVFLYSVLSFKNKYYGEVLIYIFIMLPLFISGVVSWIKNVDEKTNTVKGNVLTKKEYTLLTLVAMVLFVGLYYLLDWFDTDQLFVSTLSILTSLYATYLIVRRSKYAFLFYMFGDIILLILWGTLIIKGEFSLIPMLINPIITFINDFYAFNSWNKREKIRRLIMRNELTIHEIESIKNNEWVIFSTANEKNEPRAIVVIPSVVEKDKIILSNIQMAQSIKNIKTNPNCFIDVYIKEENDKQIKITGTGKVEEAGQLFEEIKTYEETNNLPEDLKVNSIVIVEIKDIEVTEG